MAKKKKTGDVNQPKKKSRAKYEYPEHLDILIKEVNIIPIDEQLPDFEDLNDKTFLHLPKDLQDLLQDKVAINKEVFLTSLKNGAIPNERDSEFDGWAWLIYHYRMYDLLRTDLLKIVKYMTEWRVQGEEPHFLSGTRLPELVFQPQFTDDKKLTEEGLGIVTYIKGVSLDRIRSCEICGKITGGLLK